MVRTDPVGLVIERDVVMQGQADRLASWLYENLMADRELLREHMANVELVWEGFDQDARELWEIPEVIDFVRDLDRMWPCSLFMLHRSGRALQVMTFCLTGATASRPSRGGRGQVRIDPEALRGLLEASWFPTLNKLVGLAELGNDQVEELTASAERYLAHGPA